MIVVVPMAGRGTRFADKGYDVPKPLIKVAGKPMIYWALKSLEGVSYNQIIFIALREHEDKYGIKRILSEILNNDFELLLIDEVTEGQLCTVLAARDYLMNQQELLIISSDSLIRSDIGIEINRKKEEIKGIISVINMPGNNWSFARTDSIDNVVEVAEKVRISDNASTGIYYFSDTSIFLQLADDIITKKEKTKGEYYIIPIYQKMIEKLQAVKISVAKEMWDLGTPEAKLVFEKHISDIK
jgi:NDP-sugar pyrophosphorylase family protein